MKIKLLCRKEKEESYRRQLQNGEIRFGSPADLILMEPQFLLDERVEVVTDTALPFVKSEQQDAIEIREFCLSSGYDYYSGGLRITYRPGEGEAAIERVLPVDWYAPGGIYQF